MRRLLWTVLEGLVAIADIVEEVDLILARKECGANRVHGGVAPALVVEAPLRIEMLEKLHICLTPPQVEVADLKVGPEMTVIITPSLIVAQ